MSETHNGYSGDSVYERAQKFLKDGADKGKTDNTNSALTDKVRATKYLKSLRDGETIDRDKETKKAQLELISSMEQGGNPANYLDSAKYAKNGIDFGADTKKGYLEFNKFDTQKGYYKRDTNRENQETAVLFQQTSTNPSTVQNSHIPTIIPNEITSNSKYSVQKSSDGSIYQG